MLRVIFSKINLAFVLLFGLIPYRILGLFGVDLQVKILVSFICLIFFLFAMSEIVPLLLNSLFVQAFFFYCLRAEEYLNTTKLYFALIFASCIPLELTIIAGNSSDPYFWYALFFFLVNLYYRLKNVFLDPEFEGSIYKETASKTESFDDTFNWDHIVFNMSTVSCRLFKTPIENQLGKSLSQRCFPFIAKRYVVTRVATALKGKSELIAATGIFTGILGAGYSEHRNTLRHREIVDCNKMIVEAQKMSAESQKMSAESQKTLAESQKMLAEAQNRANDLREKELTLPVKAPSLETDTKSTFFSRILNFLVSL